MGNEVTVPKKMGLAQWEQRLLKDSQIAVMSEQGVGVGNYIQTRGGRLVVAGAPVKDNKFKCVVLDHLAVNAYYGGAKFDADNPTSPVCYAFGHAKPDGSMPDMAPHEKAHDKQNDLCQTCKWNAFKTDDRGKGKACKNIRRLALIHVAHTGSAADVAKAQVHYINVPVTSVGGWANYVRNLGVVEKRPPYAVVTEVELQPDDRTQFRMVFNYVEKVKDPKVIAALYDQHVKVEADIAQPYPEIVVTKTAKGARQKAKVGARR